MTTRTELLADIARIDAEPLHVNSDPRDGWYYRFGPPRDPAKPMGSRPKMPVRIWTVVTVDETGDRIDNDVQYVMEGDQLISLTQDDWLFLARRPISEDEYNALYLLGDWK